MGSRKPFVLFAAALFTIVVGAAPTRAHEFFQVSGKIRVPLLKQSVLGFDPEAVIIVPRGGKARVLVEDDSGCTAELTASIEDGAAFFAVSSDPSAPVQDHIYSFTGQQLGLGVVAIHVTGSGGNCNEDSDNLFWVAVVDAKTADKEMLAAYKQQLAAQKKADKAFVSDFGAELAGHLGDAADGILSVSAAFDLIQEAFDDALDLADDELAARLFEIYSAARTILETSGFDSGLVGFPAAFSSNDCSPYRLTVDTLNAESRKTYDRLDTLLKKGVDKLVKLEAGAIGLAIASVPPVPVAGQPLGLAPVEKAPACPTLRIRKVSCEFEPLAGTYVIKVKGKADPAQGGTITVDITGPRNAMGVPAYSTSTMVGVGSDCKWDVIYQSSAITPGSGEVTATQAGVSVTSSYTCN